MNRVGHSLISLDEPHRLKVAKVMGSNPQNISKYQKMLKMQKVFADNNCLRFSQTQLYIETKEKINL